MSKISLLLVVMCGCALGFFGAAQSASAVSPTPAYLPGYSHYTPAAYFGPFATPYYWHGWGPHYYHYGYPYYGYRHYRPHRYRYGRYHYALLPYHLPRYFYYPKYNRGNQYYYADSYRPAGFPARPPRVAYVIGDGKAPAQDSQYVVRIVSRIEPRAKIEESLAAGRALLAAGDYRAASSRFLKAMSLSRGSAEARLLYARACAADGRYGAASFALKRAIARDTGIIKKLADSPEIGATIEDLRLHILDNANDSSALFVYGIMSAGTGRTKQARAAFVKLNQNATGCGEAIILENLLD